jgi:hypothetical protein
MRHVTGIIATLGALGLGLALPSPAWATTVVAQWNMDNDFGTTMTDSSGNGNDGTTYNIVTSGGGYIFDGGTSKVIVPNSATLNPGASDFSYSVQIQTDTVPPNDLDYDLLRKGISTTKGGEYKVELINVKGKAKALCVMKDSQGHSKSIRGGGPLNLADNVLRTITCTKTSTSISVQVTSRPLNSKPASLGSIDNTSDLTIGVKLPDSPENDLSDGDWYKGLMRSATITVEP